MLKLASGLLGAGLLAAFAATPQTSSAVRADLAPTGRMRVGMNFSNALLAAKDAASGEARGVAVDLARELGRRVGVPVDFVSYDAAGKMADAVNTGAWDVAFLGVEAERAADIAFTAPYLEVDASYLVPAGSPLRVLADVDREGVRIALTDKSAYDLFLTRNVQHARLMRAPTPNASINLFVTEKLDALAGLKPALLTAAESLPGSRVLDGRFMTVQQGVGTPKGRDVGAQYLRQFVEDVKASGLAAQLIASNGVRGVTVPTSTTRP